MHRRRRVPHISLRGGRRPNRTHRGPVSRTERAATLTEYALIVSVFVVPTMLGLSFLQGTAENKMGNVAANIAERPTTTEAADGGGGGGGPTTVPTTAPTSTTSTTTSTTTTTTSTTTTTTAAPVVAKANAPSLTASIYNTDGNKRWKVAGTLKIATASGTGINGARVTIKVEEIDRYNQVTSTSTKEVGPTNASGNLSFEITGLTGGDRKVRVTVTAVTGLPAGTNWDQTSTNNTANRPSNW